VRGGGAVVRGVGGGGRGGGVAGGRGGSGGEGGDELRFGNRYKQTGCIISFRWDSNL
jgi:hypothetical protein